MENPYAPPKDIENREIASPAESGMPSVWQEGGLAVCNNHAIWPDRCVVCNAPTNTPKIIRNLFWHPSGYYLLVFVSWLIYLIVAMVVRKKGTIHISMCEPHRIRRRNGILIGILGFVGSLVLIVVGATLADSNGPFGGAFATIGAIGIIAAPITGAVMARTVSPKKINDNQLWIRAGKPFIDSL